MAWLSRRRVRNGGSGPAIATLKISGEFVAGSTGQPSRRATRRDGVPPRSAYLIGQLRYGGMVQMISADGRADAVIGLPRLTLAHAWTAAPQPFDFEREDDVAEVPAARADGSSGDAEAHGSALRPFTVYRTQRRLIGGICWPLCGILLLATIACTVTVANGDVNSGYFAAALLCGLTLLPLAIITHLAVNSGLAVNEYGVTVVTGRKLRHSRGINSST